MSGFQRMILRLVTICLLIATSAESQTRGEVIVGQHVGPDPQQDLLPFVVSNVKNSLFDVHSAFVEESPPADMIAFMASMTVRADASLETSLLKMLQEYASRPTALLLMSGTFQGVAEGTESKLVIGQPSAEFQVATSTANLIRRQDHADEREYLNLLIAYAMVREAQQSGSDPRLVAIPVARKALEWAENLDVSDFPDLSAIVTDLNAVLPR